MKKILFLCLGNICRSPLAEGVFSTMAAQTALDVYVDSAGTGAYHIGELPYHATRKVAKKYGIELTHKARQLKAADFQEFDYILAMDNNNFSHAAQLAQKTANVKASLHLFREFDSDKTSMEVADPYYGTDKDFEVCYQTVKRCSEGLLEFLQQQNS
jgi:protein-tyrosine phosphatase